MTPKIKKGFRYRIEYYDHCGYESMVESFVDTENEEEARATAQRVVAARARRLVSLHVFPDVRHVFDDAPVSVVTVPPQQEEEKKPVVVKIDWATAMMVTPFHGTGSGHKRHEFYNVFPQE